MVSIIFTGKIVRKDVLEEKYRAFQQKYPKYERGFGTWVRLHNYYPMDTDRYPIFDEDNKYISAKMKYAGFVTIRHIRACCAEYDIESVRKQSESFGVIWK